MVFEWMELSRVASLMTGLSLLAGLAAFAPRASAADIPADSPIRSALENAEKAVQAIVAVPADQRTFENTVGAVDDLYARLEIETNFTQFLAHVSTDAAERERGQVAEQHFRDFLIDLSTRTDLYEAVKAYAATKPALEGERARLLRNALRDYRRAGMDLSPEARAKLVELQKEIGRLGIAFEKNIRDDKTRVPLTRAELAGMPDDFIAQLPREGDLYLCGMDYPTYIPLMEYCENEGARRKLFVAYKRRGGEANIKLLEQILELRAAAATLLGYSTPADFETEVRMAKSAANVMKFYDQVRPLVRKKAEKDFAEYQQAKREHTGVDSAVLAPWDTMFYEKRLLQTRYAVDARKVQEHFPLDRVIDGLFRITQTLYGLEYRDITSSAGTKERPLWHPDVRLFAVIDRASGAQIGEFYIDLFPRENKFSHAAQWGLVQHKKWSDGRVERPLAALVCNFTKPTPDKPSLLTHDEVETFFHEFGHCLHTLLSEAELYSFSGTNVARDFVEAPSQMFENWVWDGDVLRTFAAHYQTGEPLPDDLLAGMLRARHLGSGLNAERQFYYGLVDMTYHTAPGGRIDTTREGLRLAGEVELYQPVPDTFFQASFGHLIGYNAGYYGYMWSLVYACDMFERFRERGMMNPEAGMYYRQRILSRGGTTDELELVREYLGREPKMDAFLEHLGLKIGQ